MSHCSCAGLDTKTKIFTMLYKNRIGMLTKTVVHSNNVLVKTNSVPGEIALRLLKQGNK